MKIGFVIDDTLDKTDGVQQYVLTLGAWFKNKGHEVHYLAGETYRTDVPHVHSLSRNLSVKFNQNRLSIPLPVSRLAISKLLKAENFDVLHVQMPYSPFLAAKIIKAAGHRTAVVGTFHILPFSNLEKFGTHLLGLWLRRNLRRFDATIAVSEAAAKFANSSFGINPVVLPNVINLLDFQTFPRSTTKPKLLTIVFLGRLVPRKGVMQLLQALTFLPAATRARIQLRIAGKGPLLPGLQEYVNKNNLKDVVAFEGFVSEKDKPAFLNAADIAIFPALGGESFGIVLIEAMAARAGVVMGGNNPGYRTVLKDWPDTLVDASDSEMMSKQLSKLIANPELRDRIHAQQQEAVVSYDVATVSTEILKIYDKALKTK